MKRKNPNCLLLTSTFVVFSILLSCTSPVMLTGQTITENRDVPAFSGVSLAFSASVFISQEETQSVEIEADESVMDIILTEVRGQTLVLRTRNGFWGRTGQVKVRITVPDIRELQVSGSGDILTQTPVSTDEIAMTVSGSGSIEIDDLQSPRITSKITGSGDIRISGHPTAGEMETIITGSGSCNAEDLEVSKADIKITGSGSTRVNVSEELITRITGSGSVLYRGNPIINASSTGSGRTRSIN